MQLSAHQLALLQPSVALFRAFSRVDSSFEIPVKEDKSEPIVTGGKSVYAELGNIHPLSEPEDDGGEYSGPVIM